MASSEITVTIDGLKAVEEAQEHIDNLKRKVSKYHRLYQQANGRAMRYARTKERIFEDKLFLKRKIRNILSVLPDDANWHNAPDYIVHFKRQMIAHAKQANHYQKLLNGLAAKSKNSMSLEKVQELVYSAISSCVSVNAGLTQEYVNRFIEEWRKNNDC